MSLGLMFLSAALTGNTVGDLLQFGRIEHLFRAAEIDPYSFVQDHVRKHQSLPAIETVQKHTGVQLTPHLEAASYYLDLLKERHIELTLKKTITAASGFMAKDNKNATKALEIMMEGVMALATERFGSSLVDFREAYEPILGDYVQKYQQADDYGLQFGWKTFDEMSGGIVRGDLVSFVGRPGQGKTFQMLYAAMHGWKREGMQRLELEAAGKPLPHAKQSRLFVSMEMGTLPIMKRLSAMIASIPRDHLKHASLSTPGMAKLKEGLVMIKGFGAPFWVVDGALTATVEDIFMLCRQLSPGACFIDGAYLLQHPIEKDRFKRAGVNCNLIKQNITPICPTVASWQFAKSAAKGGKKGKKSDAGGEDKATLEDIGFTDAIAQDSSIVLGLLEADSVETLIRRLIRVLKGRSGEVGDFLTNWNFSQMDFSEYKEPTLDELSFV